MRKIAAITAFIGILTLFGCTDKTDSSSYSSSSLSSSSSSSNKNYIANKNSGKLHSTNCDSLPYEENRIYFSTIDQAHAAGYTNHHKECMGK